MSYDDPHIISDGITILDALDALNKLSGEVMTLLAVDAEGRMTGTLTDGDIRRCLLQGSGLLDKVRSVMHRNFRYLHSGESNVAELRRCRQLGISLLPVLDDNGCIQRIIDLTRCRSVLPVSAILMAGGRGERLRPLTLTTPKPLLKIGSRPIIDYNVESLAAHGITDITVTTNYLAEMIHEHFSEPLYGVNVKCLRETAPLGTLGAVSLVERDDNGVTLVMNSDLLTTISYEDMYLKHIEDKADITVASVPYMVSVPYAILMTDGSHVNSIEEKPTYTYQANAGIYLINNSLLNTLKPGERIDTPELIERAIADGRRVSFFPISGLWMDIGSPSDFKQAQELMRHHHDLTH